MDARSTSVPTRPFALILGIGALAFVLPFLIILAALRAGASPDDIDLVLGPLAIAIVLYPLAVVGMSPRREEAAP